MYEEEYLNGKRNRIGKKYYDNGNLMFAREYLKGKRWNDIYGNAEFGIKIGNGKVKEYNDFGEFLHLPNLVP